MDYLYQTLSGVHFHVSAEYLLNSIFYVVNTYTLIMISDLIFQAGGSVAKMNIDELSGESLLVPLQFKIGIIYCDKGFWTGINTHMRYTGP